MNFIVSVSSGVAVFGLADHDARLPDLVAVVHDLEREVRDVQHDMRLAEVARHPAPALHIGEDGIDRVLAAARLAATPPLLSARRVAGPTEPSASSPALSWKLFTASTTCLSYLVEVWSADLEPLAQQGHASSSSPERRIGPSGIARSAGRRVRPRARPSGRAIRRALPSAPYSRHAAACSCRAPWPTSLSSARLARTCAGSGGTRL